MEEEFARLPWNESFKYSLVIGDNRGHAEANPPKTTRGWAELIPENNGLIPVVSVRERTSIHSKDRDGWDSGPSRLWDFLKVVRDDYYEGRLDSREELPLHVKLKKVDSEGRYIMCIMDSLGGRYLTIHSDELYSYSESGNCTGFDSTAIQETISLFRDVYENPQRFLKEFREDREQMTEPLENCDAESFKEETL